ncbi:hypothetical protein GEMRC1_010047 [Eukaryota sp. GEM-RC1]
MINTSNNLWIKRSWYLGGPSCLFPLPCVRPNPEHGDRRGLPVSMLFYIMLFVSFLGLILWLVGLRLRFRVPLMPHSTLDLSFLEPHHTIQILGGRGSAFMCFQDPPLLSPSPPIIYKERYSLSVNEDQYHEFLVNLNANSIVRGQIVRSVGSSLSKVVVKGRENFREWKRDFTSTGEGWCTGDVCEYRAKNNSLGASDVYYFLFNNHGMFDSFMTIDFEFDLMVHDLTDCRKIDCDLDDCDIPLGYNSRVILQGFGNEIQRLNVVVDGQTTDFAGILVVFGMIVLIIGLVGCLVSCALPTVVPLIEKKLTERADSKAASEHLPSSNLNKNRL